MAIGDGTGAVRNESLLASIQSIVQDADGKLSETDWNNGIAGALSRYSKHRPKEQAYDITGNGTHVYAVPDDWVKEFSSIRKIEYPIGENPPSFLDEQDDFAIYKTTEAEQIMLPNDTPAATETFRMTYTIPRTEENIAEGDQDAVANLAASICLGYLASYYIGSGSPTVQADVVDHQSKSSQAAARAKACLKFYNDHFGIKEDGSVPAAGVIGQLSTGYPGGSDRLTHPTRERRNRWR